MKHAIAALLLLCTACADSTGPSSRDQLQVGRYAYASPLGTGTVTITFASADSVAGSFAVQGAGQIHGPIALGGWNTDAYVLYVTHTSAAGGMTFRTTYSHRVTSRTCQYKAVPSSEAMQPCTLTFSGR